MVFLILRDGYRLEMGSGAVISTQDLLRDQISIFRKPIKTSRAEAFKEAVKDLAETLRNRIVAGGLLADVLSLPCSSAALFSAVLRVSPSVSLEVIGGASAGCCSFAASDQKELVCRTGLTWSCSNKVK
jgi:hypothetical protein